MFEPPRIIEHGHLRSRSQEFSIALIVWDQQKLCPNLYVPSMAPHARGLRVGRRQYQWTTNGPGDANQLVCHIMTEFYLLETTVEVRLSLFRM